MSRRICMDLHDEIAKLRPAWVREDDEKGIFQVIMTGNAFEGSRVAGYYGYYAAVVRAKRRRTAAEAAVSVASSGNGADGNDAREARSKGGGRCSAVPIQSAVGSEPDTAERRQLRKNWGALIRRVYEVDPLLCPCGATMRIVAVITERSVITKILAHLGKVAAETATEGAGPGPSRPRPSGRRPPPPSTEPAVTGWCDYRMGRSLFERTDAAAQIPPTHPPPPPPCARTAETAFTSFEDQLIIVNELGKRSEKLGISHALESNAKCFSLSPVRKVIQGS